MEKGTESDPLSLGVVHCHLKPFTTSPLELVSYDILYPDLSHTQEAG